MVNAVNSKKSSKTTKHEKQTKPPAEHQPVTRVEEIPIALVEIRQLAANLKGMEPVSFAYQNSFEKLKFSLDSISTLINSLINTLKLEGLRAFVDAYDLDREEMRLWEHAVYKYAESERGILSPDQQLKCEALIALFEALQVNNNDSEDQVPEVPGMSEKIDQEIELWEEMKKER